MTDALPNGLVKTISNVPEELGGFDKVRVEDIAQLWRGTLCDARVDFSGEVEEQPADTSR